MLQLFLLPLYFFLCHHTVAAAGDTIISLHGVGTESPCVQYVMDLLQDECEQPCRLTYRIASQSNESQSMLLSKYAFGVDQVPFDIGSSNDDTIYTFPIGMNAWGLYSNLIFDDDITGENNVGPYLNLTKELIGNILFGNPATWDDQLVLDQNPALKDFVGADTTFHDEIAVGIVKQKDDEPVFLDDILKQPWSKYLDSQITNPANWPKQLKSTFGTKFLIGSTPEQVRDKMTARKGLAIAFLPYHIVGNADLTEVPLTNRDGQTLTPSEANPLYHVSAAPDSVKGDFNNFPTLNQSGENVWPLLITEYLFVRLKTFTDVLNDAQRGLLLALIDSLYSKEFYSTQCGHRRVGGVTATQIPKIFKDLGLGGLLDLNDKSNIQIWHQEEKNGISNEEFVITQERQSYQRYEISHLTNEVARVQDVIRSRSDDPNDKLDTITETLESLKIQYKDLATKLEDMKSDDRQRQLLFGKEEQLQLQFSNNNIRRVDDVALDMNEQQPTFTDRDQTNIEAALVLAAISFTLWMLYFAGKIWWFFSKP
mmetsp:Transcript_18283/g.27712  ORF Transcript_18283/g.27712 Transcript_18283/m.27712 type:complete len:539 (+) Transcript_18283:124-1740(+)